MSGPDLLGIIGGISGVLGVVVILVNAVRNGSNTPEATWQAAIKDLKIEMAGYKFELAQTRQMQALYKIEVDDLRGVVLILTAQLRENGIEPRAQPQPRKPITGPRGQAKA